MPDEMDAKPVFSTVGYQLTNTADKRGHQNIHQNWLSIDWLSMVLHLRQHNIGYTADGFYRSDDPTNSVKALKEGG